VGSLRYQQCATERVEHPRPSSAPKRRHFSKTADLRYRYKTLDKARTAIYSCGGQLACAGETVTGRELDHSVANVLELETALLAGDLTPQEQTAFRLSLLSGLVRSDIAEEMGITQRRVGNLIGSATRKLVRFVYDQAA